MEELKVVCDKLARECRELSSQLKEKQDALRSLQKICPHPKWKHLGHDSHYNHEQCRVCGYVDQKA